MKENTSEKAYEHNKFIAEVIGCDCYENIECSPEEYDKGIAEIEAMIDYSISIGNKEEISQWRKMFQKTKEEKRHA